MKILQVNSVYRKGSTGKIVYDLHCALLDKGVDSIVCYGRGKKYKDHKLHKVSRELYSKVNNILSRISGLLYGGFFLSTQYLISVIKKERPDIVHLQCINGYFINIFRLVKWLKNSHIKTVLTLHAEFMYTANCGHALDCNRWKSGCGHCPRLKKETRSWFFDRTAASWKKMKKAFDGFNDNLIVVSVSPWLMDRAKQSPILADKRHMVVYNGLDTNTFHHYECTEEKKRLYSSKKIVFHATPYFSDDPNQLKGGYYVIQLAKMMENEDVIFLIAGKHRDDLKVPSNCILLGQVLDQNKLAQYYSMADVTLLTSKKETFSMVTAESLCCGTPVVGFKAGAPEQIAIPRYSTFVDYGDIDALYHAVIKTINSTIQVDSSLAQNVYSSHTMCNRYFDIYSNFISK